MNARWFRDHLSVLIFSVAFAAILGGIIWFLKGASAEQATVVEELEAQQGVLSQLLSGTPFPSITNITILKGDHEMLKRMYSSMQNAAMQEPIRPPVLERDVDFLQFKLTKVSYLEELARAKGVMTPDTFAWGFSRYDAAFPCRNPVANKDVCKKLITELARQLLIIEKLGTLLIDSKVDSIGAIRRTEIEPGNASADALAVPIAADPKALYQTYPFEVVFTTNTDGLRNFINNLAKADCFFLVRNLKLDVTTHAGKALPPVATPEGIDPLNLRRPTTPVEVVRPLDSRRLNVTMRIDLIEFTAPNTRPGKS